MMNFKYALLTIFFFANSGFLFGQVVFDAEFEISRKAMAAIQERNVANFEEMVDENVLESIGEESLLLFMNDAFQIVNRYEKLAAKGSVMLESETDYFNKNHRILSLIFPFPPPIKGKVVSGKQIVFSFSDDINKGKLVGFKIRDFESLGKKKRHLDELNLRADQISSFRIYYDQGASKNGRKNHADSYALSGDQNKLKIARLYRNYREMLSLINAAEIDSIDTKYNYKKTSGHPEYLLLEMYFWSPVHSDLGKFSIFTILSKEGVDEINQEYIIVEHSRKFRYLFKISDNMELWNKMVELAHINHPKYLLDKKSK